MTSPAQVSGPGALSQRTDAGGQPIRDLPDPDYGEATAYREQQKGAPLAEAPRTPTPRMPTSGPVPGSTEQGRSPEPPVGLFAPTQRPDEPITAGAPVGAGPNTLSGGPLAPRAYATSDQLRQYAVDDASGSLAWLANFLHSQGQ